MIRKEFIVDEKRSIDKRKSTDPSIFGYASVHLIIELSEARTQLPEYAEFRDLKCELQVRTVLQHAWAEIEHDIVYKASEDIPFELRRRFASLAGLLEVADREFESLRKDEIKVRERIKDTIRRDDIRIPVDMDSLKFYLEKYQHEKNLRIHQVSVLVGFLARHNILTIDALDSILTKEALKEADESISEVEKRCKNLGPKSCLIRYFIAVGNHLNMPLSLVGEEALCPALENPEEYSAIVESTI